jgi:hypothetical protein
MCCSINSLCRLATEHEHASSTDFGDVESDFALEKAEKAKMD